MGGLALFHNAQRNVGPDGPSAFRFGACGSMLVDSLSPKAAPVGDEKNVGIRENRVGRIAFGNCAQPGHIYYISIKFSSCAFPLGDPTPMVPLLTLGQRRYRIILETSETQACKTVGANSGD
jgi:hypothetical protein